jgi:YqjK-like protein
MRRSVSQIESRRRALVAIASVQRSELAVQGVMVEQSLRAADLAVRGYRYLRSHSLVIPLAVAALAALGPRRVIRLGYRSGLLYWVAQRLVRSVRAVR